jgi:hypothetical protein
MKRLTLVALFALACGALPAHAQALSLAYHAGDTFKYSFHSTTKETIVAGAITVQTEIDMSAGEVLKVNSVDSSGVADLSLTLNNFVIKSTTGGTTNSTSGIPDKAMDIKIAADGRILSMNGNQYVGSNPFVAFAGMGGGFFVTAVLPSTAVKPGDTWSKDYSQPYPDGSGSMKLTSHSKYLRDESLQGVTAALVETTSNGSVDFTMGMVSAASAAGGLTGSIKGTVTADVTTWIDPNGHRVLKTHSTEINDGTMIFNLSGTVIPGMTGPITTKGTGTTDLTPA